MKRRITAAGKNGKEKKDRLEQAVSTRERRGLNPRSPA
jgi:hypothetical protein